MPPTYPASSSTPRILVAGATGNTGSSAVKWLSQFLSSLDAPMPSLLVGAAPLRVLALTRDIESEAAKKLTSSTTSRWFRRTGRRLITSGLWSGKFPASTLRHTTSQRKFGSLPSTVLRANVFVNSLLQPFIGSIRARNTVDRSPIRFVMSKDAPVALVDPNAVGAAAASLLALPDPPAHYGQTYNVSGPTDISGETIIRMIEKKLGEKLTVEFESMTLVDEMLQYLPQNMRKPLKLSLTEIQWKGLSGLSVTETNPELLELNIPRTAVQELIDRAFE
ncbi:hypothetical protein FI667_g3727, partial [Globisporangium splendens]